MYFGKVNRPAACSPSSPDPSRLTSMSWLIDADRLSAANVASWRTRLGKTRSSVSLIACGRIRFAPRSAAWSSHPGASAKLGSFRQSRNTSRPSAARAQK